MAPVALWIAATAQLASARRHQLERIRSWGGRFGHTAAANLTSVSSSSEFAGTSLYAPV